MVLSKKWLPVMLVLIFALMLSACSSNLNDPEATENTGQAQANNQAGNNEPQQEPVQQEGLLDLSMMLISWGTTPQEGSPVQKKVEERSNTKIKFTWVPYNEYESRQNVGLASGDLPDMVQLLPNGPQLFTSVQVGAIEKNVFHDLSEFIKDPEFSQKYPNLAQIPQSLWDKVTFNGGIYSIPRNIEPETFTGIWIREDLFEKVGLEIPTTTDELAEVIIALSDPANGIYGLDFDGADRIDAATMKALAAAFTGSADWGVNDQGDFAYRDFKPEYKDYLAWLKRLYDAKAIHPEFALGQRSTNFGEGTAAVHFHRWHAFIPAEKQYNSWGQSVDPEARAMLIKPVQGPKMATVEANRGFWTQMAINSKVPKENIPRILAFLDWMASQESLDLFLNGVEGVHYELKDGERVKNETKIQEDGIGGEPWIMQTARDPEYFFTDLENNRGATPEGLTMGREVVADTVAKYEQAVETLNYGNHHFNLYSPALLGEWDRLTKDLKDNRVKVVMGQMTFEQWDRYVEEMTSSPTYQKILEELKQSYLSE